MLLSTIIKKYNKDNKEVFEVLHKENTNFCQAISVEDSLAIRLRFLASGDFYHSLMSLFKVSKQSISKTVPEVCTEIVNCLNECKDTFYTRGKGVGCCWLQKHVAVRSMSRRLCIGKHVVLQSPENSGS